MKYYIEPLEWKVSEVDADNRLYAMGIGRTYTIIKLTNDDTWDECLARYTHHYDDHNINLAKGINIEDAKKACAEYHEKQIHKIIEKFVRIS